MSESTAYPTTLEALREAARELGIPGRSSMDRPELEAAIAEAEDAARQAAAEAAARAELEGLAKRAAELEVPGAESMDAAALEAAIAEAETARTVRAEGRPPLADVAVERYEHAVSRAMNFDPPEAT